ncbi:MAG: urease accessory protein UreE [Pseudomonadales bacterium]|jgi:urease accessory protein|nr:urease accessory protein UreE [Pseudomonadales bacterium]
MGAPAPRATAVELGGEDCIDSVRLDFDARHRRRFLLTTESGREVLLDLPEVPSLQEGHALVLENGERIRVCCAEEALLEVRPGTAVALPRLAWHLGNRHLPTEIGVDRLWIREDHVIEALLERLGADVRRVQRAFHPEGGAYGHGRTHGHDHRHVDDDDDQDHHDHAH